MGSLDEGMGWTRLWDPESGTEDNSVLSQVNFATTPDN